MTWVISQWGHFCLAFLKKRERRRGEGRRGRGGSEGEGDKFEGDKNKLRERKHIHLLNLSWSRALMTQAWGCRLQEKMDGLQVHIWSTTDRRDALWPLGSNMPNNPTWQTISQYSTSRLHYFSNGSQHARQAIPAYQPLLNLSPFPIKGIMRVLQMQKFHQLKFPTYCMIWKVLD